MPIHPRVLTLAVLLALSAGCASEEARIRAMDQIAVLPVSSGGDANWHVYAHELRRRLVNQLSAKGYRPIAQGEVDRAVGVEGQAAGTRAQGGVVIAAPQPGRLPQADGWLLAVISHDHETVSATLHARPAEGQTRSKAVWGNVLPRGRSATGERAARDAAELLKELPRRKAPEAKP